MEKRLAVAIKMLDDEKLSVKAIALSSGFSNSATFCNAFKREFGSALICLQNRAIKGNC